MRSLKYTNVGQTKFINPKLTMIKIQYQVKSKYQLDPHRTRLTLIAELTWSNLGLKEVLKKYKIFYE